jgi:hypothetical protein
VPFQNILAFNDAAKGGGNWIASFRKNVTVVTVAGQWFDFSGSAGNPVPNYYASAPLTAATLEAREGIYHGSDVAPATKYVHRLTMMGSIAAQNIPMYLCDYLLYYPFIDMDAAGEEQVMDNTVTLPRYTDGVGVQMMLVTQAAPVGGGQYTIKYINQDDVEKTTINQFCPAVGPNGSLLSATSNAAGVSPFVPLADQDTGVKRVVSITFSVANGGLCAIVLVKPLFRHYLMDNNMAKEKEVIVHQNIGAQIYDGAYLNFIGQTNSGSISGGTFVGLLETIWE